MVITKEMMAFLADLEKNNNRDWFNERKKTFKEHEAVAKMFFAFIESQLNITDNIEDHKVYRIYRDVRFSQDKTPFKARFAGGFKRATAERRGGYFLNIQPGGKSIVGGGFYGPNKEDLMRIRQEFEKSDKTIRSIMNEPSFKKMFGQMHGEGVKSAPRGFDKDHPAIDLIKKKQFVFFREFSDAEVVDPNFGAEVIKSFEAIRPFFDYMSEVLTTDLDGNSILQ